MSTNERGPSQPGQPNDWPHDPERLLRGAQEQAHAEASLDSGLPTLEELQQRFPEFEIRGLVGRGGMGAVYRAFDPKLDREVAIKVLPGKLAADPEFTERFRREARALARLQHPHILTVHDFGARDGTHFVLTEFVDGVDLRRLLAMGQLPPEEALRIVPQVCGALQHAHDHGVVHRDVKPENVLIDTSGNVRVADFGLAKLIDPKGDDAVSLTAMSQVVGTPHYMAPEQLHGRPVDHRADIFALGVMLYEMLTGQLPVGHFAPPSRHAGTGSGLDQIVMRALENDPADRYQAASQVGEDLRKDPGPRDSRRPVAAPSERPRLVRGPLIALLIVLLGGVAFSLFRTIAARQRAQQATAAMEWVEYEAALEAFRARVNMGIVSELDEPPPPIIPGDPRSAQAWDEHHRKALERFQALYDAGRVTDADRPVRPHIPEGPTNRAFAIGTILAPFLLLLGSLIPLTGFRAMARIRRARGQLTGAGLAVFTAWGPLLLGAWALLNLFVDDALHDHDTEVLAQLGLAVLFLGLGTTLIVLQTRALRREAGLR